MPTFNGHRYLSLRHYQSWRFTEGCNLSNTQSVLLSTGLGPGQRRRSLRRDCVVPVKCLVEREHTTPQGWRLGGEKQWVRVTGMSAADTWGLVRVGGRGNRAPRLEDDGRMAENMAYLPRLRMRVVPLYQVSRR